jgi:hypothetical protein
MLFTLAGCGDKKTTQQETDKSLKQETKEQETKKQEKEEVVSVKDKDAVYDFISTKYNGKYTREDFDKWKSFYMDINNNKNEEVAFSTTYGDGNLEKIIFITGDNGKYEVIPSDIALAKYENTLAYDDGFISVTQKGGGSGAFMRIMNVYVFDGKEINKMNLELIMENIASLPPGSDWRNQYGDIIEGDLNNFVFVTSEEDSETGVRTPIQKIRYIFDKDNMNYKKELLQLKNKVKEVVKEEVNDYKKGYTYDIENNALFITYKNTGKKVKISDKYQVEYAEKSFDESKVYFTTTEKSNPSTYYINLKDGKVVYVNKGAFFGDVGEYPYTNYVILSTEKNGTTTRYVVDRHGKFACDLGVRIDEDIVAQIASAIELQFSDAVGYSKLEGFDNETINSGNKDLKIIYSDYRLVVIPMHQTINQNKLARRTVSFGDNPDNVKMTFSIFGELENIKITYFDSMDASGEVENIGTLKNSYVDIYAPMLNDMSHIKVTGKFHDGEGYYKDVQFTLDDMRDKGEYKIINFE